MHCLRVFLVAAVPLTSGCVAAYSPPIRSGQDGAPGRLHAHEIEATGTVNYGLMGGPNIGYAATDNVAVEAGAETNVNGWAIGYGGARITYQGRTKDRDGDLGQGFVSDMGVGAGAGKGGSTGFVTPAGGGYLMGGAGYFVSHVAFYARSRFNQSFAQGLPPTFWWSLTGGLEVWAGPFSIFAETGGWGYQNEERPIAPAAGVDRAVITHIEFWLPVQGGVALHFDVAPKSAPKDPDEPSPPGEVIGSR